MSTLRYLPLLSLSWVHGYDSTEVVNRRVPWLCTGGSQRQEQPFQKPVSAQPKEMNGCRAHGSRGFIFQTFVFLISRAKAIKAAFQVVWV